MIKGFKEFILRGNVIDLAVAVVIGAAFTAIVNVIVSSLINPLIGVIFQAGSLDTALQWTVPTLSGNEATFSFGAILGAVINFVAVAAVVYFVFVHPMNILKKRAEAKAGVEKAPDEPQLPTEQELLIQIRDLLDRQQPAASAAPPKL
jgi:large conductance mechanosensitive channel